MTVRAWFGIAADRVPLPAETLGGLVAAVLAQQVWPLTLPPWTRPPGVACAVAGLAVVGAACRERGPGSLEAPVELVTRGLHGVSRNPMYLGFAVAHLGLAGATRNGWMLVTCPASTALLHRWVLREERWLAAEFGDAYDDYRRSVARYL